MAVNRDFGWLRKTLCDEIEAVRAGKADHNRAKSVAGLAAVALKSVEVEAMLRQQQSDLAGKEHAALGTLPLCGLPAPDLAPEVNLADALTDANDPGEVETVLEFKVGDRVMVASGKHGTVRKATDAGRIEVEIDDGETLPYPAKYLTPSTKPSPTSSPLVPKGARVVAGKAMSGGR